MAEQSFQEKTEPATPKKLEELKGEGRVAKSTEVSTAAILFSGTMIVYLLARRFVSQIAYLMKDFLSLSHGSEINQGDIEALVFSLALRFFVIVGPILIVIMITGVITNVLQTGFIFTLKPMKPKGSAFNPLQGLKKLGFSQRSLVELVKNLLKITLVGLFGYLAIVGLVVNSVQLTDSSPVDILSYMGKSAFSVAIKVSAVFVVIAAADYIYQRKKFAQENKMSKQDVKEEQKQQEGDPAVKGRLRREMTKRHRMRMMQSVPKADVVVTNPTHYAIAIKYDAEEMAAPKVVAKGKDYVAQKIKEIAIENDVPIVEDKPLAQLLYKTVEIDEQIPADLFKAVAQILAYVYQIKKIRPNLRRN